MDVQILLDYLREARPSAIGSISVVLSDEGTLKQFSEPYHGKRKHDPQYIVPLVIDFKEELQWKMLLPTHRSAAQGLAEKYGDVIEQIDFPDSMMAVVIFRKGKNLEICARAAEQYRFDWIKAINKLAGVKPMSRNSQFYNARERGLRTPEHVASSTEVGKAAQGKHYQSRKR